MDIACDVTDLIAGWLSDKSVITLPDILFIKLFPEALSLAIILIKSNITEMVITALKQEYVVSIN